MNQSTFDNCLALSLNEMYSTDVLSRAEFTELCLADGQL